LIDGELIEMEPTEPHEEIAAFILRKINVEIDRLGIPWFIPLRYLIKLLAEIFHFIGNNDISGLLHLLIDRKAIDQLHSSVSIALQTLW